MESPNSGLAPVLDIYYLCDLGQVTSHTNKLSEFRFPHLEQGYFPLIDKIGIWHSNYKYEKLVVKYHVTKEKKNIMDLFFSKQKTAMPFDILIKI